MTKSDSNHEPINGASENGASENEASENEASNNEDSDWKLPSNSAEAIDLSQLDIQLDRPKTEIETENEIAPLGVETKQTGGGIAQHKKDHKTLARFYGFCISILGLISLVPAIIFLIKINQAEFLAVTPRWIYLLIFVGALHIVYAVYLIQVADWSSLWAVSILMLVASFFYGVFSTAILLDDGFGPVVQFLQLPVAQMKTATIACLVGLCLSVLTSYLCGREALNWKKNEKILFDVALRRKQAESVAGSYTPN